LPDTIGEIILQTLAIADKNGFLTDILRRRADKRLPDTIGKIILQTLAIADKTGFFTDILRRRADT